MKKYVIEQEMYGGSWERVGDTFDTELEAQQDLHDHITAIRRAVELGYMDSTDGYEEDDFRITPIEAAIAEGHTDIEIN